MKIESKDGLINGRGIDFDSRDRNFWVTDFGGNIYKIAGFETKPVSVNDNENSSNFSKIISANITPNPLSHDATISYKCFLDKKIHLKIQIISVLGTTIGTIFDADTDKDSSNYIPIDGESLTNGVYNVIFIVDGKLELIKKMVVLK